MLVVLIALAALLVVLLIASATRATTRSRGDYPVPKPASPAPPSALLALDALIFEIAKRRGRHPRDLLFRILNESDNEVGYVVPTGVYDRNETKVLEILPPLWPGRRANIADGGGRPVGSVVPEDQAGRDVVLRDTLRRNAVRIQRQRGDQPDVGWNVLLWDSTGLEIGRIIVPRNRGATDRLLRRDRPEAPGSRGWRRRLSDYLRAPNAFLLLMRGDCGRDKRLLMLGYAALEGRSSDDRDYGD